MVMLKLKIKANKMGLLQLSKNLVKQDFIARKYKLVKFMALGCTGSNALNATNSKSTNVLVFTLLTKCQCEINHSWYVPKY